MTFFEEQMRQMFGGNEILHDAKFVDKTVLAKLDDDLRVKLQFITSAVTDQYDTIRLCIINRTNGVVDQQNFKFSDIIGKYSRPGLWPLDHHIWAHGSNGPEWYAPISVAQKAQIADTILDYVSMYQK